jgi:hypothetical protein
MAMVIHGHEKSLGHMVSCVRLMQPGEPMQVGPAIQFVPDGIPCWYVEPPVMWRVIFEPSGMEYSMALPYCSDRCLLPIRPEPDEDLIRDTELLQSESPFMSWEQFRSTMGGIA